MVKRLMLALRMREKLAAATPVNSCAARTVSFRSSSTPMIFAASTARSCLRPAVCQRDIAAGLRAGIQRLPDSILDADAPCLGTLVRKCFGFWREVDHGSNIADDSLRAMSGRVGWPSGEAERGAAAC